MSEATRRNFMKSAVAGGAVLGTTLLSGNEVALATSKTIAPYDPKPGFRYCFNTSCIRKKKLPLNELIDITAKAGYDGIEPWIGEIDDFVKNGGKLGEVRKQLDDHGLKVESAIGFPNWCVNDDAKRKAGFEEARRGMDLVKQLGGAMIAAPPVGVHRQDSEPLDLNAAAERYAELLELGESMGVIPQLEIWGPSKNLSTLSEAAYVAVKCGHPKAAILPDVYHLFRGGSDFDGLALLAGNAINLFHMNDYPEEPPREQMNDSDRVYPGDGVAPLDRIIQILVANGFKGALSLELFNRTYWEDDPSNVAKVGLAKMKAAVNKAVA